MPKQLPPLPPNDREIANHCQRISIDEAARRAQLWELEAQKESVAIESIFTCAKQVSLAGLAQGTRKKFIASMGIVKMGQRMNVAYANARAWRSVFRKLIEGGE